MNYKKLHKAIEQLHNNPPIPFNPEFDPGAKARYARVTASMEADNFYNNHTRKECAKEWRRRYEEDAAK